MDKYLKHSISDKVGVDLPIMTKKKATNAPPSYPRMLCLALAVSLALGLVYHLRRAPLNISLDFNHPDISTGNKQESGAPFAPKDIQHLWGYFAPYRAVNKYEPPPPGCTVKQVNILHRHGARFPELVDRAPTMEAVQKYQRTEGYEVPELQFLMNYSYDLGLDDLVKFGGEQSWTSGAVAYARYKTLIDGEHMPFVRASLSERVVETALNWSAGFHVESKQKYQPQVSVYIDECPHCNNTLFNNNCPEAETSHEARDTWIKVYASSIADRLNSAAIGLQENITAIDAFYLMMMCPFDTLHRKKYSSFCKIFSKAEWEGFEYAMDLEQYYKTGYGQVQDLGRVQGVGYVNELLARFTDSPVEDETQTNHTLDDNPKTFPLNKTIYIDFGHDHEMIAVYSAMGLFEGPQLDPFEMRKNRKWFVSDIVPFAARMSAERLECTKTFQGRRSTPLGKKREREGEYVRILINDAVQPLDFCGGDDDGLCKLKKFVKSQQYARTNGSGNFRKCGYKPGDYDSFEPL